MDIIAQITSEFHLQAWQVENVVKLIDEGNTIPFIARYRKEAHGTLDDQMLREIAERLEYLRNLDKRREEVRASIEGQEKLTEEISAALSNAATLAEIEDIYRPFKPKRRTRASIAREKGRLQYFTPGWCKGGIHLAALKTLDAEIPFTRETWNGRMRACRGVGASLPPEQVESFTKRHRKMLEDTMPEKFFILYEISILNFQFP